MYNKIRAKNSTRIKITMVTFTNESIFVVNVEQVSVQLASNGSYITPFLNKVSKLESSCFLRNGFNLAMKNVSKFLRVLPSF